jgi:hypothetical protein
MNRYLEKIASTRYIRELVGQTADAAEKGLARTIATKKGILGKHFETSAVVTGSRTRSANLQTYRTGVKGPDGNPVLPNKEALLDRHRFVSKLKLGTASFTNRTKLPG